MCGICGFITKRKITYDSLKYMNHTMAHRGPDDSGEVIYDLSEGIQVGLGHRRLSIFDLSELGHQPMMSPDGRVTAVYNGEIYNYKELRKKLKNYPFRSGCDTEVLLAAYLEWGIECVKILNGMFAFAILDRKKNVVYMARDRIGKKPFYYYWNRGELVFGSELKPIMAYSYFDKDIDIRMVSRFLCQQYINAPETVFQYTYKLEPGTVLKYSANSIKVWKYWSVPDLYHKQKKVPVTDYNQAKTELKALLVDAVKIRMAADVPVGIFLSGGYDSSLVAAIAQNISDEPIRTYTIGFKDKAYDEADYARGIAKEIGSKHKEYYITEREMISLVDSIPKYYDEPFADPSQIPSMLVAAVAGKDVRVVLTGDGGDEFFCGYNIYDMVRQAQWLEPLGNMVYAVCGLPIFQSIRLMEKLPSKVRVIAKNNDKSTQTQIMLDTHIRLAGSMVKGFHGPIQYPVEEKYHEPSWQKRRMLLDMDTYLPGDILCKVDRATMRYSVEARCPLLDYRVMEYSYRIPQEFKYQIKNKKRILKDLTYEYIPKKMMQRPKKGFSVPLDIWLRGPLRSMLLDFCGKEYIKRQGIFDSQIIRRLVFEYLKSGDGSAYSGRDYSRILWSYLCFQKWYQMYVAEK